MTKKLILFYFSYRFLQDPRILSVLKQQKSSMILLPQKRLLKIFSNDPADLYHVIRFIILTELMLCKFLGKHEHLVRKEHYDHFATHVFGTLYR